MIIHRTTAQTIATMTETCLPTEALLRLMTWLSPSFPVGAFSYSHGLEWAVESGAIGDRIQLTDWISELLRHGGGWSDAVLFSHAFDAASAGDADRLTETNALAEALAPSRERHLETMAQGTAFMKACAAWPDTVSEDIAARAIDTAYPVAVAMKASGYGIGKHEALAAYLHAFAANLISAAVRLVPLGQSDGVRVQAQLEDVIIDVARLAGAASLDDIGGAGLASDIAAMKHETQYTRLFRS